MGKRTGEAVNMASKRVTDQVEREEFVKFDDPFGDEFEPEEIVSGDDVEMEEEKEEELKAWIPHDGEAYEGELDYDPSAYTTFHKMRVEWPCLSFDVVRDGKGHFRSKYPLELQFIAATQAEDPHNKLSLYRVSDIHKTKYDGDDSDEEMDRPEDEEEYEGAEPIVEEVYCKHPGGANRVRAHHDAAWTATWADDGRVHIWDIRPMVSYRGVGLLDTLMPTMSSGRDHHITEGFALDWSSGPSPMLASGDCDGTVLTWQSNEDRWQAARKFQEHASSVEDIQWSPNEPNVFSTCSVDRSIRFWDIRVPGNKSMAQIQGAHDADVNVLSWNKASPHLIASGGDEGALKIWDLRILQSNVASAAKGGQQRNIEVARFTWHKKSITSLEWHPIQQSVLAASSDDHSISFWDLGLEDDPEAVSTGAKLDSKSIPAQLLFLHHGQRYVKEVHFHPQIPSLLLSTSQDGFDLFKPDNLHHNDS